ncbi:MAG TPA: Flp family type IVb pilin [Thermoguttaceae bacterium]|nr:Flp family type IVb pilin [Thermoguttaceae bacterium]HPP53772.1 Flp family type IVb pilin [Thermoguttaceae bacterium]
MKLFTLRRCLKEEQAATSVEYAVMLALILMVVIAGIAALGGESHTLWGWIQERIEAFMF